MGHLLDQIGGLILGSVPTILFFLLLLGAYGVLVRRPLAKTLHERHARTEGAMEQARGAIGAAEAETAVFEDKLRAAKREIAEAREARMKKWAAEREQSLAAARQQTQDKTGAARKEIEQGAASARQQIETLSGELSQQILKAVLPAGVSGAEAAQ